MADAAILMKNSHKKWCSVHASDECAKDLHQISIVRSKQSVAMQASGESGNRAMQ